MSVPSGGFEPKNDVLK
uniref:Uncharacterized protein n=1 Tax=Anguilla anguilla TaxID=7936 RepID=A0A0E9VP08_ANGAN